MDWKKIDSEIRKFAASLSADIEVKDIGLYKGKITNYTFHENGVHSYKLVHPKPDSSYGGKFQIVSSMKNENIEVTLKKNFFGFAKLKIEGYVSPQVKIRMEELSNLLFGFSWKTKSVKKDGMSQNILTFVTNDIEIDMETMEIIREIHQELDD